MMDTVDRHGIGLTVHEEPYITASRTTVLEPNVTFTMEPLFMIPHEMGLHTEDMYLMTVEGFEPITGRACDNKNLITVG